MLLTPRITKVALEGVLAALAASGSESKEQALRGLGTADHRFVGDLAAQAFALTLADLAQQGWSLAVERGAIAVSPPVAKGGEGEALASVKERQRASLLAARSVQLGDPSVRDFIRKAEAPSVFAGRRVSIADLIDDGHALAAALRDASRLPPSERDAALCRLVQPEIEVVASDRRCAETGLSLMEVWRYFRHTWSLEYRPTPGRSLLLLVRNRARPNRPVMGIASVASALPQLRVREEWIQWSPHAVLAACESEPASWAEQREALLRTLQDASASIRTDDLLSGAARLKGEKLEQHLRELASAATSGRIAALRERQESLERGAEVESLRLLPTLPDGEVDWRAASERPLFRHKRAKTAAAVMFAERVLSQSPVDGIAFAKACATNDLMRRALAIALKEIRKVGLASRLLELNVCGAVQPYNPLLVGKLVALAVGSADVVEAFRERYRGQVSEIASQMAGRGIVRSPDICALTTTSLYAVAASQYNRLHLAVRSGGGKVTLRWQEIGETEGFGTVHLSDAAVRSLRRLSTERRGGRWVNNVFGEGNSARLRQVREGLEELGLEPDAVLRHSQFRKMYGLEVFPGGLRALRLNLPLDATPPSFAEIASAWRERWLANRVNSSEALQKVAGFGPETVRDSLIAAEREQRDLFFAPSEPNTKLPATRRRFMPKQVRLDLVRSLYRDAGAVAEYHDADTVDALHIGTKLDAFIRARALDGDILFVTGNPGDGKTHVLKRLEAELKKAKVAVCLDANELAEDELADLVDQSMRGKAGCVIAINEGILVGLLQTAKSSKWSKLVQSQLLYPFNYIGGRRPAQEESSRLKVVDLNQRNNLARSIVEKALSKLISFTAPCAGCPGASACTSQFNAERMCIPEVSERVVSVLDAVARTGFHATMRDLHGFIAHLIVADATCEATKEKRTPPLAYWERAFVGGQGPLFDAVRRLDPQHHPLPLLDDKLWRQAPMQADWMAAVPGSARLSSTLAERQAEFVSDKRRALFEHRDGAAILDQVGSQAERALLEMVRRDRGAKELVGLLNRFFDRDEEDGAVLRLWVTHRYDARPTRFAASANDVATSLLEVRVPALRPSVADAFEDFKPDHVLLCLKAAPDHEGLRVDTQLLEALLRAEQGLPATFRRGEPEARISAFFDRLAKQADEPAPRADVRFVDMNSGMNLTLSVDIAGRRYSRGR